MTGFDLDSRLAAETSPVGALDLSAVRLMDDARFPWAVVVPRRPRLAELIDLSRADRAMLIEEIAAVSEALQRVTGAEKMNVAALGNQVRQLHIHVIARFAADAAWPNPVWGVGARRPYRPGAARAFAARLAAALGVAPGANTL